MPSLEFRRLWRGERGGGGGMVSIWRPVGPPGYKPLGDVISQGVDPPSNPVEVRNASGIPLAEVQDPSILLILQIENTADKSHRLFKLLMTESRGGLKDRRFAHYASQVTSLRLRKKSAGRCTCVKDGC